MPNLRKITQAELKHFGKIAQKKYRHSEGEFFIEGVRLVEDALDSDWNLAALALTDAFLQKEESHNILKKAHTRGIHVVEISISQIDRIAETVTSQGIVGIVKSKHFDAGSLLNSLPKRSVIVALEDISDPGNLGTILRTCDWFGVKLVLLNPQCVELHNPKVVRSTMGAIFHLPICTEVDLLPVLAESKKKGRKIIVTALEGGSSVVRSSDPDGTIVVFGNEARGVSPVIKTMASDVWTIPRYGRAESLNVSVACGIVLSMLVNR
jgi:TrmH family RNA methyltransferase